MNNTPSSPISRRELIRTGGLALSMGAILAACGSNRTGSTDPGRLGVAPPAPTLPEVEVNDVVLLRTAQSLAHTNVAVYAGLLELDVLSSAERALMTRCSADHVAQSGVLDGLIAAAGGEPFACPNPFLLDRAVTPTLAAIDGSDDPHRDVINIAHAFEKITAASYQDMVTAFEDPSLRAEAARAIDVASRHSAAIARLAHPSPFPAYSPELVGEPAEPDASGFPVLYAIPSVFGLLSGVDLLVGIRNSEGTRYSTQLQTPAANSFVYDYQSC
jgi:hypothetical protein